MALTLQQYASYLDTRADLPWPAAPEVERPKARPHLARLPDVRAVLWNVYGTLLAIPTGDLLFQHPQKFVLNVALDKTIQEFKMWASMSRKPGQPADYMAQIYEQVLLEQKAVPGGAEKYPEVLAERVWEAIIKKLLQKDYRWDTGFYGALNELSQKVAYFFHASMQGTACYPGAAEALRHMRQGGLAQGLLADGQCFTRVQLQRGLTAQDTGACLDDLLDADLCLLSHEPRARKPSERLFRPLLEALAKRGLGPAQVLHVGSRLAQDIIPARRLGMKTALFAGDRASLLATPEQLKEAASRPDVLLTELTQIADVVG
ncbi:MAG TPA: HAD hydrolase-like protein [Gemmataceae bacterium]|nr:HAD hydrolase-like protein [Gemmataceae bacterium]